MVGACPVLYIGWKFIKKTEFRRPEEVDLVKNLAEIEEYQRSYVPVPPKYVMADLREGEKPTDSFAETVLKGCWTGCLDDIFQGPGGIRTVDESNQHVIAFLESQSVIDKYK